MTWVLRWTRAGARVVPLCAIATQVHAAPVRQGPAHILGGQVASDLPDVVALLVEIDGELAVACTGTLVAPDVVLTAAHCVRGSGPAAVAIGASAWREGQMVGVARVASHPILDAGGAPDLGLVWLDQPVAVTPRRLAGACDVASLSRGDPVTLAGYGTTDAAGTVASDVLLAAQTTVIAAICDSPTDGCGGGLPEGAELLAGGDQVDACPGDSGGPVLYDTPVDTVVLAVTSRPRLGGRTSCGDGGIFVRVDAFTPWLEEALGPLDDGCAEGDPDGPGPDGPDGCTCATGRPSGSWILLLGLCMIGWRRRTSADSG